jgi:hypothetical protein
MPARQGAPPLGGTRRSIMLTRHGGRTVVEATNSWAMLRCSTARGGDYAQLGVRSLPAAVPTGVAGWLAVLAGWCHARSRAISSRSWLGLAVGPVVNVFTEAAIGRGRHEHTADGGAVLLAGATAMTKPAGPVPAHGAGLRR